MKRTIYLDGLYRRVEDSFIASRAPGHFKPKGVFETMLGIGGFVLDGPVHLRRLRTGLKVLGLRSPMVSPNILPEVLKRNRLKTARLRLSVWQDSGRMHVMVAALPYKVSGKPLRACLIATKRAANSRMAEVKSLDYALFMNAYLRAKARGFDEALLLNRKGHIFEASRANVFWVKQGVLHTPPLSSGCLNGTMRRQVMLQARKLKVPFKEKNLTQAALKSAENVFLTNSLIGIKPIVII